MSDQPNYTRPEDREAAWATLAKTPAFVDFFLPYVVFMTIDKIRTELLETCTPEEVPGRRYAIGELQALRRDAANHMKNALTKATP